MKMSEWTDTEIRRAVIRELTWDPQIQGTQFGVVVSGRVVTLLGAVDSYSKRMAAQEAAFKVAGVLDVVTEVEVRLPGRLKRTDIEIAQMVRRALDGTDLLSSEQIRSTVSDGWVTLEGTVDHGFQREDAERAVRDLASVHGVTNLVLVDRPSVEPTEVLHEI
ncbi:MAG: BON domain-containing protein [Chloroflexi bacterium]|nr:BON domain-containing protein [Chloroflexota bacterium]